MQRRPWARFDDLTTGSAVLCPPPDRVLRADRPDDVAPLLAEVERATAEGRWAWGYLGYEAASGLSPDLVTHSGRTLGMPLGWFGIGDEPVPVPGLRPFPSGAPRAAAVDWSPGWTEAAHAGGVATVRHRIEAGDTYQTNLTERVHGRLEGDPYRLYRDLALGQRGAYNAYLDLGRWVVASASPELFVERRGDEVLLRPMKGTARRGRFRAEDDRAADRLQASAKDRAENLMIVDLMRNDVSRIAETGSVAVPELFRVERYETVLQLTSDVTARLRHGTELPELFEALFPCGSVTGAPKASTMAIITGLEPEPRGVYCGAIGLVGPPTAPVRARFSVAIRTAVVDRETRRAVYGTGGGITWDSDPAAEHAELQAKTAVLRARPVAFRLLETIRAEVGRIHNLDQHLQRLVDSAHHLGFRCDPAEISRRLQGLTAPDPGRVRLLLDRDGGVELDVGPVPPGPAILRVGVDDDPVDPDAWWLFHKTTLRDPYERRLARRPDVDEVIMVNTRGELTELTRATLAVRLGDRWCTPPLESGCLPGTERARLLAAGELTERVLAAGDLDHAEGIAAISSLRGWRSAYLVAPGPDQRIEKV